MKRIILQIGHKNIRNNCDVSLRGSTGAGGELEVNQAVVNEAVKHLLGIEVKVVDANYNCDPDSLKQDWDLFLAVHCDMDYANDTGSGFCDYPEPSRDASTKQSQAMAKAIQDYFFPKVGINVKSRSNANTKYYYMWECISEKTPCVLIEMGQVKDPHDSVILKDSAKVGKALAEAILVALGLPVVGNCEAKLAEKQVELDEMRESRDKWKVKYEELDKQYTEDIKAKTKHIEELQKTLAEQNAQLTLNAGSQEADKKELVDLRQKLVDKDVECQEVKESLTEANKENERLNDLLIKCQDKEVEAMEFPDWKKALIEARRVAIVTMLGQLSLLATNVDFLQITSLQDGWKLLILPLVAGTVKGVIKYLQEKYGQGDYTKLIYRI